MSERRGTSIKQVIIALLVWVALSVLLFTLPGNYTLTEKIIYSVLAGVLVYAGMLAGQKKMRDRNRRR